MERDGILYNDCFDEEQDLVACLNSKPLKMFRSSSANGMGDTLNQREPVKTSGIKQPTQLNFTKATPTMTTSAAPKPPR